MRTLLTLSLLLISKVAVGDTCPSGRYTQAGGCCSLCPPGYGVSVPCGESDTVCEPCRKNSTFSDVSSATAGCQPCSSCQGAMQSVHSTCTPTQDTACHCPDGHYLSDGVCLACQVCSKGHGAKTPCSRTENTECQLCPPGSYSEVKSSVSPCLPCRTQCLESEVQIGDCTPLHDFLCMNKDVPILKRKDDNSSMFTSLEDNKDLSHTDGNGHTEENTTMSGSPQFISPEDHSKNIIPVYCSILAAVVVGLIGYVAFKCWVSCKQKKLLAKQRAGELAASGEGEKLHSDSGVFLDTHSLQEQNQLNKAKLEPKLYINLPPHKQEEVERLLTDTSRGKDWQRLASLLGYEEDTIDTFGRGEDPVHTLLTDWSSKDSSTLEVLCAALVNMERADVVESLNSTADASSVV
ncbi:tumor necrosis factor receptor superfamily member 16-like isoform X1 [Bufo gargarizans]|uniref:tumor necrosis factor receptor superfamily member 16-like isoform X1 n=2 Tax=Bufo gargarizans TaxID=30331 RepID=UPI001CF48A1D|nr:tumor necrosis factor receptor superfamily member 16-like isoform X1 [Bufo gargarizans]